MRRGQKPAKSKAQAKRPVTRKSPKDEGATIGDLENRLAATAEILRLISSSPADAQPIFEAIADRAMRLFRAWSALVFRYDGELLSLAAARGGLPGSSESFLARFQAPRTPDDDTFHGRTVITRAVQHIADVEADAYQNHHVRRSASERGFRSVVWVPMLRGNEAVGAVGVSRVQPGGFSDAEIALLQTFADQAVIAIENVRLFTETKEALEQQTATSEILRVISTSPTDAQPVFDTIAANAARLCVARDAQVLRVEGGVLKLVSACGSPSMAPVRTISRGHAVGRAVIDRRTIHVRDMAQAVAEFSETSAPHHGVESLLAVPLLRDDVAVGIIRVSRTQIQPFTEQQIALLQTFADQAVIAIENRNAHGR
jgi:two-component system, NtrC family, sensor kinase